MFGKILGKVLSTPIRIANVPLKVASKAADAMCGERNTTPVKYRDPLALDQVADAIDEACEK